MADEGCISLCSSGLWVENIGLAVCLWLLVVALIYGY